MLAAPGRPYDLILVCAIPGTAVLLSVLGLSSPLISALAFLSVFFLPGWALVSAIFPGRRAGWGRGKGAEESVISLLERLAASVVLSLLMFALGGIALAWSPLGFQEGLVLAEVLLLNVALAALAMYRRFQLPQDQEFVLAWEWAGKGAPLSTAERAVAMVIAAAGVTAILIGAGVMGGGVAPEPYAEFFITGPDGSLGSLPQRLSLSQNGTVLVNFVNQMGGERIFELSVGVPLNQSFDSETAIDWDAPQTLHPGAAFVSQHLLPDGGRFSRAFQFGLPAPGVYQVEFHLDFGSERQSLWLFVTVT